MEAFVVNVFLESYVYPECQVSELEGDRFLLVRSHEDHLAFIGFRSDLDIQLFGFDEVVGVFVINLREQLLQAKCVSGTNSYELVPVRESDVRKEIAVLRICYVTLIGDIQDLLAHFEFLTDPLTVLERLKIVYVKHKQDRVSPADVFNVLLEHIIVFVAYLSV